MRERKGGGGEREIVPILAPLHSSLVVLPTGQTHQEPPDAIYSVFPEANESDLYR